MHCNSLITRSTANHVGSVVTRQVTGGILPRQAPDNPGCEQALTSTPCVWATVPSFNHLRWPEMTARRGCLNTGPSLWLLGCRLLQSVADDPRQAFTQGVPSLTSLVVCGHVKHRVYSLTRGVPSPSPEPSPSLKAPLSPLVCRPPPHTTDTNSLGHC